MAPRCDGWKTLIARRAGAFCPGSSFLGERGSPWILGGCPSGGRFWQTEPVLSKGTRPEGPLPPGGLPFSAWPGGLCHSRCGPGGMGPLQRVLCPARLPVSSPPLPPLCSRAESREDPQGCWRPGGQIRGMGRQAPALMPSQDSCWWPACPSYLPNKMVQASARETTVVTRQPSPSNHDPVAQSVRQGAPSPALIRPWMDGITRQY